eukprot:418393_1
MLSQPLKYGLQSPWFNTKTNHLTIGQLIETFDLIAKTWAVSQIIDIKDNLIQIHWYGWSTRYDEWINKYDKRLAPLQTHTLAMTPLLNPQKNIYPNPLQPTLIYDFFIIGNVKYNIKTNKWVRLNDKSHFNLQSMQGIAIDRINNIIFNIQFDKNGTVFTSITNSHESTFDFIQHSQPITKIKQRLHISYCVPNKTMCQVIKNELHVIGYIQSSISKRANGKPYHHIYNINKKQWTLSEIIHNSKQRLTDSYLKIIYVSSLNAFIIFASKWYAIGRGDYKIVQQWKWNGMNWIISNQMTGFGQWNFSQGLKHYLVQIFDHLLLVKLSKQIMIFDLLTLKWFKCSKLFPIYGRAAAQYIVNTMDNYVHILDTYSVCKHHYKVHLMDIIPVELDKLYR